MQTFGPRSGLTKSQSWSGSKRFETLIVLLKEFFEKVNFEQSQQTTTKAWKITLHNWAIRILGMNYLWDNCIQNFHLGRYIVKYTVGNLVLTWRGSGAVKRDFRPYIRWYTSPNENFEYGYPHSNVLLQLPLKLKRCKPHKAELHPTICDVMNGVKLFQTVYRTITVANFWP